MRTYISGAMTGVPEWNYPAFNAMAEKLRAEGHVPVNPADYDDTTQPYRVYMLRAMKALMACEAIMMLKGWEKSNGARMEWQIAVNLGLTLWYEQ